MRNAKVLLVICLLLILGVAVYFWLGKFQVRIVARSSPAILHEIQDLNQLVTVKYSIQRVVAITETKVPVGEESLLMMVEGDALGGIDLSTVTAADFRFQSNNTLDVTLPRPRILHVFLNEGQTKVWDRHITWWTPWVPYNPDLEHQARLKAVDEIRAAALKMDILGQAQSRAEDVIRRFLETMNIKATFRQRSDVISDAAPGNPELKRAMLPAASLAARNS